jgi:S-formylglutathione hydrolase FrmB
VQTAWNQLTAGPLPDQTDPATVTAMQETGTIPGRGTVVPVTIPADASHFKHRTELVYLPPAWYASNPPPRLPVVMMVSGEFNTPADWLRTGNAAATIDDFAASHGGHSPVFVFVDTGGSFNNDTECVNGTRGNAADHLTKDVVPFMISRFGVNPGPANWGVVGWSMGGTCAVDLTVTHPELFSSFVDIAGDSGPTAGTKDQTIARLFRGDANAWAAFDPTTAITRHGPYTGVSGWFAISSSPPTQHATPTTVQMPSAWVDAMPPAIPATRPKPPTHCVQWAKPTGSTAQYGQRRANTTGRLPPRPLPRRCHGWPGSSAHQGCHGFRCPAPRRHRRPARPAIRRHRRMLPGDSGGDTPHVCCVA